MVEFNKHKNRDNILQYYKKKEISTEELWNKVEEIANNFNCIYHFREDYLEGIEPVLWKKINNKYLKKYGYKLSGWVARVKQLSLKPDVPDVHQFWCRVYQKIEQISSIHEQSKEYNKLTSILNPAQLLQCDYYHIVQILQKHKFRVISITVNLRAYAAGYVHANNKPIFQFVVRKKPWIIMLEYYQNDPCVGGSLVPHFILNTRENKRYQGENFFSYQSLDEDVPNVCPECLQ